MNTVREVQQEILTNPEYWCIALMDFVDDFRYYKQSSMITEGIVTGNERFDAILASVVESLCDETGVPLPEWTASVPACSTPWFVSGMESLKAIALVETPLRFRIRNIFVLNNFLSRV